MWRLRVAAIAVILSCASSAETETKGQDVPALLDAAVTAPNRDTQQASFQRIEDLGCAAVLELVEHVDDRRPLPYASISLWNNFPEAFEDSRHYAPKVVGEAVAALLTQMTGQNFGAVYNGATPQELMDEARQWREYARTTAAGELCLSRY